MQEDVTNKIDKLVAALRECKTDAGAYCQSHGEQAMRKRLEAINSVVAKVLEGDAE
jgi:hypothetical protein